MRIQHLLLAVSFGLFLPWQLCYCQNDDNTSTKKQATIDEGFVLRGLCDDALNMSYFLNELAILDSQASKIQHLVESYKKNLFRFSQQKALADREVLNAVTKEESDEALDKTQELEERISKLDRQVFEDIDATLLPHQFMRLKQALFQRLVLRATQCETFEFPLFVCEQLELSDEEENALKKSVAEQTALFLEKQQRLKKKAWEQLYKDLPPDLIRRMEDVLGTTFYEQ